MTKAVMPDCLTAKSKSRQWAFRLSSCAIPYAYFDLFCKAILF